MSESGDLSRRSRSYDPLSPTQTGSERSRRIPDSAARQAPSETQRQGANPPVGMKGATPPRGGSRTHAAKQQQGNLWQILFGRTSKPLARRSIRSTAGRPDVKPPAGRKDVKLQAGRPDLKPQAGRKDFKATNVDPPRNFLQRLKPGERSRLSRDQAAAKLAQEQVRQAVFGRSQQFNNVHNATFTASTPLPRGKRLNTTPKVKQEAPASLRSASRAIPAFQAASQANGQAQTKPLAQQREGRQRNRRGLVIQRHHGLGSAAEAQVADTHPRSNATRKRDSHARPRSRSVAAGLYAARMLILSVGIGVLVGTLLSVLDPAARLSAGASQQATKQADTVDGAKPSQATAGSQGVTAENAGAATLPKTGQELAALKAALQTLVLQSPQFTPGIFLYDLDTSAYVDLNGGASFAAASTIKVPILVAFFQDVDAGKIRLDERLTLQKDLVAGGSGELQGLPLGTQITALETVTKMITISDNTATNMVIARLGGMAALDQRFRSWGMVSTAVNNMLPDLNGTNTTSPKDMAFLMTRISQGELVSMRSRDRLLDIMQHTVNRSQLPQGLGKGATIAHKTGDIGGLIGDVGLIDMPTGKRYSLTVLVKRAHNDDQAYELVANTSRIVYQFLNRVPANQSTTVSPSAAPEPASPRADGGTPTHPDRPSNITADTTVTQSPTLDTEQR